jgi:hypothetical protein
VKVKLKEDPREWQKLVLVLCLAAGVMALFLWERGRITHQALANVGICACIVLCICLLRPRWFRGFYRLWMTGSHYVGQFMGQVMLTLMFVLMVIPLGLFLRLIGKDPLRLKRPSNETYWQPARNYDRLDRLF